MRLIDPSIQYTEEELYAKVTKTLMLFGVPRNEIHPTADFRRDLGLSTYEINVMLMSLEFRFNISIAEEAYNHLATIRQVVRYLNTSK